MQPVTDTALLKQAPFLKQPLLNRLIRELRRLGKITQGQAAGIGVSSIAVSHWEADRIQPSEFALRQVPAFIEKLSQTAYPAVQGRSKKLLASYFVRMQG